MRGDQEGKKHVRFLDKRRRGTARGIRPYKKKAREWVGGRTPSAHHARSHEILLADSSLLLCSLRVRVVVGRATVGILWRRLEVLL